jgi:valyl-tRNA synthetase
VHSIIQAPDGRRMSKSLGTGLDPLDLIEGGPRPPVYGTGSRPPGDFPASGADAVRFGLLAMSRTQDVRFNEDKIAQGSNLGQKLWSASRLILGRLPAGAVVPAGRPQPRTLEDRWILSRLARAKESTAAAIEGYEFHRAALGLYDFVYGELCDWYLEWIKPRLYGEGEPVADVALHVLAETLAMAHPMIPFVTEEIWSHVPGADGLLAASRWPERDAAPIDDDAEALVGGAIEVIRGVRGWRDSVGAPPGSVIPARLDGHAETSDAIARLGRLAWEDRPGDPVARVAGVALFASEAVDLQAHERRLAERRKTLEAEIARAEGKLANERFVAKAPPEVVQAERDKLDKLRGELAAQ